MQDKLTARQIGAWSWCALSAPAAMVLAGRGWGWVLAGSAGACAAVLFVQRQLRRAPCSLPGALTAAFGAAGGRIAAGAELLWLLLASAGASRGVRLAFEDDPGVLAPAVILLLAALAGKKGRLAAGRIGGVLALCIGALYGMIALASVRQLHAAWCRPWGSAQDAAVSFALCLTPMGVLFVLPQGQTPPASAGAALSRTLLPAGLSFLTSACLSPALVRAEKQPLSMLTKSLSLLSVMQRFEALLSVAQMLGLFTFIIMCVSAAAHICEIWPSKAGKGAPTGGFCLAACVLSIWAERIEMWVWALGATIFWGLLPILTLVIVKIKNSEK